MEEIRLKWNSDILNFLNYFEILTPVTVTNGPLLFSKAKAKAKAKP